VNPYFALSAIFLLGLRGIEKKLSLPGPPISQYGEPGSGKKDKSKVAKLAASLEQATQLFMREGSVAREVFGDDFVEHFGGTREHEVKLWNEAVTNWEREYNSLLWTAY
jgi:glutamine synthetase